LTEEFCGNKNVTRPSCGTAGHLQRVIGYYAGWSIDRTCGDWLPEDIPKGVYTHINYAFASIDPTTFEVVPASIADTDLYPRVTSLKQYQPDLKVYIAIGGWTFNDPGPTGMFPSIGIIIAHPLMWAPYSYDFQRFSYVYRESGQIFYLSYLFHVDLRL